MNHIEPGMDVRGEIERGVAMKRECTPYQKVENRNSTPTFPTPSKLRNSPHNPAHLRNYENRFKARITLPYIFRIAKSPGASSTQFTECVDGYTTTVNDVYSN